MIKECKQAVKMTQLSCHRCRSNEVRLWLSVMAHNLGNLWRRLVLPRRIENWSLTSLHQRLVKTGGGLVKHARYYWLLLEKSGLTRRLFGAMLRRIAAYRWGRGRRNGFVGKLGGEGRRDGGMRMEIREKIQLARFRSSGAGRRWCLEGQRRHGRETIAARGINTWGSKGSEWMYTEPYREAQKENYG